MVASSRPALAGTTLCLVVVGGLAAAWSLRHVPAGKADAPLPGPAHFSAQDARIIRAGMFEIPVLGLDQLRAVGTNAGVLPVSLPSATVFGNLDPSEEPEIAGEPIRDGLKSGADGWPQVDRSDKVDLPMSRLPPGLDPIDDPSVDAGASPDDGPGVADDPFLPPDGAPPLARLSRQLEPPRDVASVPSFRPSRLNAGLAAALAEQLRIAGPELGGADGAVPVDHSLAPVGGTSPAASHPALAGLDSRTTDPAAAPEELAASAMDPPVKLDPPVRLASVHPTAEEDVGAPMPILAPDEGLTQAQKNARIAGLPGLDDGVARPLTLPPVAFTKAQICLATAIYFEARGESEKGQIAVAQVVINRVRSPFYPKNVCAVVYQGASSRRYGGCQFSFACDGIRDRVTEGAPWHEALDIAQRVLDAEAWLPEVGNATHYHANYVRPRWVRDMIQKDRIGKHIFYRVRGWA